MRKNTKNLIVSLTSYPARIRFISQTIESLLNQSFKADKIILWLAIEEFPNKEEDLPKELLELCDRGLTIDWCHNIKSFKKLLPVYKKYSDSIIVTVDDDVIYERDMLKKLYYSYLKNPKCIHCHVITRLYFDETGGLNYLSHHLLSKQGWGKDYRKEIKKVSSFNKLCGNGGVLYPPKSLHNDVFNINMLNICCPNNDDVWFHIQALRAGYKVKVVENHNADLQIVPKSQETALWKINTSNNRFITELNLTYRQYPELKKIFESDNLINAKIIKRIMQEDISPKMSLPQMIFSVKNEYKNNQKRKVVTIFGIKIKFNKKKL